ncbi:MAG: efflux RND transporter periplasmic adaptor subunit [Muribaculaceae bacterium]|nr:efflux RND transporter periplasmic adaptor subunit [Muribaculaceae bacterium]
MKLYSKSFIYMAIATSLVACSSKEETQVTTEVEVLPVVEVKEVTTHEVDQVKEYTATVEADNINNIAPASPNRIKKILVDVGSQVRRGQTLVVLDEANTDQLKVRLDLAKVEYDRAVNLLEIGAGTQQAVDQAKSNLDGLESQYKNLMENTVLTSPINGVVTARNFDPGDMCSGSPILTVGQLSPYVNVMINVTEVDYSKINNGMTVTVAFDGFPGETFTGKVKRVYPTVDPTTRTFTTEISINNPNQRIKPGMFARVTINLGTVNHVVVPDRAVVKQTGSGNKYVYVYKDGAVSYNKVELGQRLGDAYEIISGVNDKDLVVINGQSQLINGSKVQLLKRDAAGNAVVDSVATK